MTRPALSSAFILASASPRRLDLLKQIGVIPSAVDAPHIDEAALPRELPAAYARRIASEKLAAVHPRHAGAFVLAADTVVALGRRILPKAEDAVTARRCLELLSGRRHKVIGGIAIAAPSGQSILRVVRTDVVFKRLSTAEIERYIASEEWHGKAGGYAVQGLAAAFIPSIAGSYSNIVGLSLSDVYAMLTGLGFGE
ncbi:Maf family protein [Dongia rigui]|uniref:dTTP/UTP pyrophosphatase n=1 Tax=Dongia rigui TaxID=940149 RepID=A0ABU5E2A1_9PROT|nr:nucleoside triphosphate pyrophosphatase [Dongia rigui]MDY0873349.1 nucleoside triphosphate pyrophosphatase [Dongia rigui]